MTAVSIVPPVVISPGPIPPQRAAADAAAARFAVKPVGATTGLLDGAWWPRSDDLTRELPSLVAELDRRWGRITRITVNPRHWQPLPREVAVTGHVVKVGWFLAEQDEHKLLLLSYDARWDLLVIPPRTSAAAAARLMAAATDPALTLTASALLTAEADTSGASGAEDEWESEGGAAITLPLGRMHVSLTSS